MSAAKSPPAIRTWRERIGAGPDFPLHAPNDVERAMEAEIAELRAALPTGGIGKAPSGVTPAWHAPGMGEVHSHDHTYMIDCRREIDHPDHDYIADDDLAGRVCAAMNSDGATRAQALRDVLNTTLWLYRRLPQAYGNPPFVDRAILVMAEHLGMDDVPEAIKERARQYKEPASHMEEKDTCNAN